MKKTLSINYMSFIGLTKKVEHCLKKHPSSVNSDKKLCNAVVYEFHNSLLKRDEDGDLTIKLIDLYDVLNFSDVTRIRQKFNREGKYCATDPDVIEGRRKKQEKAFNHFRKR